MTAISLRFFLHKIWREKMSRQIQIRRGDKAAHENFIGAIGEITMDTDTKTLRVHDGETPGGIPLARADQTPDTFELPENYDFVIESGTTANVWYRKYKSGWIEQGGATEGTTSQETITFPFEMENTDYFISAISHEVLADTNSVTALSVRTKNTNNMTLHGKRTTSDAPRPKIWCVSGFTVN